MFNTIDRFLDYRFLASGEMSTDEHAFFIRKKNASFQSSCFESLEEKVKPNDIPQSITSGYLPPHPNNESIYFTHFSVLSTTLIDDCEE